jgi:hypothetical protein
MALVIHGVPEPTGLAIRRLDRESHFAKSLNIAREPRAPSRRSVVKNFWVEDYDIDTAGRQNCRVIVEPQVTTMPNDAHQAMLSERNRQAG